MPIQELSRLDILANAFLVNLETHCRRIVVGEIRIRHGDYAGLKIWPSGRNRMVKIVSKRCDTALTRKIIPNESQSPEGFHLIGSMRPFFGVALV